MKPVRIYTTPICPYCVRAKSLLRKKGAEVEEVDVLMDMQAREEMEKWMDISTSTNADDAIDITQTELGKSFFAAKKS